MIVNTWMLVHGAEGALGASSAVLHSLLQPMQASSAVPYRVPAVGASPAHPVLKPRTCDSFS